MGKEVFGKVFSFCRDKSWNKEHIKTYDGKDIAVGDTLVLVAPSERNLFGYVIIPVKVMSLTVEKLTCRYSEGREAETYPFNFKCDCFACFPLFHSVDNAEKEAMAAAAVRFADAISQLSEQFKNTEISVHKSLRKG